ncbi:MAG: DUF2220 family protein, partial [Nitrospirae bacterium]|nr:DUF2220 family protein [Nitrospirota bacterium]
KGGDFEFVLSSVLSRSEMSWSEMQGCVDRLLRDGIIDYYEFYPNKQPDRNKINIREYNVAQLSDLLGLNESGKLKETISSFFDNWEYPDDLPEEASHIALVIRQMGEEWALDGKPTFRDAENVRREMKSLSNYSLLIETVEEMFNIVLSGEYVGFRELSVRVTGDSKKLTVIRPYLKMLFEDLERYGIVEHSPLVFCRMPITGTVEGKAVDLEVCSDYVVLTMDTVRAFQPGSSKMTHLFLIENQTTFEKFAKLLKTNQGGNVGVVFISGYPPGHIRDFIKKLFRYKPFEGLVWCDLDPDGIQIALTVAEWFKGSKCSPVFMEDNYLDSTVAKPLTEHDIKKINDIKKNISIESLKKLLIEIEKSGRKVEQEAQSFPSDLRFLEERI